MSRIFISHSSRNEDWATFLLRWLAENGWSEVFLDLSPEQGLVPGEHWREALLRAAHRCEAILALVCGDWLASPWCRAELNTARLLGKKIIVAWIGADKPAIPPDLAVEQWVDLAHDPHGFVRLKEGLKRAGLNADSFAFEAGRRPFPGLAAFDERDAAVYFGRDADIVRGIDRLRFMVRAGGERLLVIAGASGAGKSSFLRAGLWPRLLRDDTSWLPLPVVRPGRAVFTGPTGLCRALHELTIQSQFAAEFADTSLASIEQFIVSAPENLVGVLERLRRSRTVPFVLEPTTVIAIDQAEELFADEAGAEAGLFVNLLATILDKDPRSLVILTIRADALSELQSHPVFATLPKHITLLEPMLEGSFRAIIEGPALCADPPVRIEPLLTEGLLRDVKGQDALPLLAYTLEQLYTRHRRNNVLTLDAYDRVGRLHGIIETSAREALDECVANGEVSADPELQRGTIRAAFVPLATAARSGEMSRRLARREEFPAAVLPLIDRFADRRLLTKNICPGDQMPCTAAVTFETIEVSHEALLRCWPVLHDILTEERGFLTFLQRAEEAAAEQRAQDVNRDRYLAPSWLLEQFTAWEQSKTGRIPARIVAYMQASREQAANRAAAGAAHVHAERMRAFADMAAGVGHAMKHAMGFVIASSDHQAARADLDPETVEAFQAIKQKAAMAALDIKQLLSFADPRAPAPEQLDAVRSIERIVDDCRMLTPASTRLVFTALSDTRQITVDPSQFEQLLTNLIVNSIEAIGSGPEAEQGVVMVTYETRQMTAPFRLHHALVPAGSYVQISIKDNGVGVAPDVLPKVFEPHVSTKPGRGRGMGLASVYAAIREMNGVISVNPAPDRGADFVFCLPAKAVLVERAAPAPALVDLGNTFVLVAEDDDGMRRFLVRAIEKAGGEVIAADNGRKGFELFRAHADRLTLLCTDIVMPEMDGLELVRRVVDMRPELPILIVTGFPAVVIKSEARGNARVLSKPFHLETFLQAVAEIKAPTVKH